MSEQLEAMIEMAAAARANAHAPYSGFKVGACLRSADGRLFAGCNVENVSFPEGQCAEASALGAMVAAGVRELVEVVVFAEGARLCTPCGGCRQRLAEFAGPETPVHIVDSSGPRARFTLGALLPHAFRLDRAGAGGGGPAADWGVALRVLSCIDLTSLNDARDDDVAALCAKAVTPRGPVAAVCSWPEHVPAMARRLPRRPPGIAAVVNFPAGEADPDAAAAEALRARQAGADELDLVFPYRAWLAGRRDEALAVVAAVRGACPESRLKVILETGAFGEDAAAMTEAGCAVIAAGADFLKTSTGKIAQGASPQAARALLAAIARTDRPVGFKASGGIRSLADATRYLALAEEVMGPGWVRPARFRIGASGLLDAVLAALGGDPAETAAEGY